MITPQQLPPIGAPPQPLPTIGYPPQTTPPIFGNRTPLSPRPTPSISDWMARTMPHVGYDRVTGSPVHMGTDGNHYIAGHSRFEEPPLPVGSGPPDPSGDTGGDPIDPSGTYYGDPGGSGRFGDGGRLPDPTQGDRYNRNPDDPFSGAIAGGSPGGLQNSDIPPLGDGGMGPGGFGDGSHWDVTPYGGGTGPDPFSGATVGGDPGTNFNPFDGSGAGGNPGVGEPIGPGNNWDIYNNPGDPFSGATAGGDPGTNFDPFGGATAGGDPGTGFNPFGGATVDGNPGLGYNPGGNPSVEINPGNDTIPGPPSPPGAIPPLPIVDSNPGPYYPPTTTTDGTPPGGYNPSDFKQGQGSFADNPNQGAEQASRNPWAFGMNPTGDAGRSVNRAGNFQMPDQYGGHQFNPAQNTPQQNAALLNWRRLVTTAGGRSWASGVGNKNAYLSGAGGG